MSRLGGFVNERHRRKFKKYRKKFAVSIEVNSKRCLILDNKNTNVGEKNEHTKEGVEMGRS